MFNKINEVKPQYTYAVQPVKLFEAENSRASQKDSFDFLKNITPKGYNPFHPSVVNSEKGGKLDLLS